MKIYIACPANTVSGGPELLHQFSFELTKRNVENYMVYYNQGDADRNPTPECYQKYNVKIAEHYVDDVDSVYVLPEVRVCLCPQCQKGRAVIWWMSVDNYIIANISSFSGSFDIFNIAGRKEIKNFVQSQYARNFLSLYFGISDSWFLSDYINDEIVERAQVNRFQRENICLYNPTKGLTNVKPLMANCRSDIVWIPLRGYTSAEMADLMCRSKLYIDFGSHPGKDRIPREAAVCGCCVITNRDGSALNDIDVPIAGKYKMEDVTDIQGVLERIYDVFDHYEDRVNDFASYRERILGEKEQFGKEVDQFLEIMQQN